MAERSMAFLKVLGLPVHECATLLAGYWKTFSTYAQWRKIVRCGCSGGVSFGFGMDGSAFWVKRRITGRS